MSLTNVRNIVLILSGKGGVGKSSVTTQLALTLSLRGHSVGVLDIDLTGPSIPRLFGIEAEKVRQAPGGWIPVPVHGAHTLPPLSSDSTTTAADGAGETTPPQTVGPLGCMSLGFILPSRSDAVIWRGPKKTAMVRQFLESVLWPAGVDFLLVDTPPGTSDEHISLLETLLRASTPGQLAGAVVVTTPQAVAVADVKKELNFCAKTGARVLGVLENMAGFVCPRCRECASVFGKGGGEAMAVEFGVPFLGSVPIDPAFVTLVEEGTRPVYPEGTVVGGRAMPTAAGGEGDGEGGGRDEKAALVDKYRSCSLYPLLDKIVARLVEDIESRRES